MKRNIISITISIVFVVSVIFLFIYQKNDRRKEKATVNAAEKERTIAREKAVRAMEERVKRLIKEQKNGNENQEKMLKDYEIKIFNEKDKMKRIALIKEMISKVGQMGVDASAIPALDEIKERLTDQDERKIIIEKIKEIMKNRDMRAEFEEYEKNNK